MLNSRCSNGEPIALCATDTLHIDSARWSPKKTHYSDGSFWSNSVFNIYRVRKHDPTRSMDLLRGASSGPRRFNFPRRKMARRSMFSFCHWKKVASFWRTNLLVQRVIVFLLIDFNSKNHGPDGTQLCDNPGQERRSSARNSFRSCP